MTKEVVFQPAWNTLPKVSLLWRLIGISLYLLQFRLFRLLSLHTQPRKGLAGLGQGLHKRQLSIHLSFFVPALLDSEVHTHLSPSSTALVHPTMRYISPPNYSKTKPGKFLWLTKPEHLHYQSLFQKVTAKTAVKKVDM